MLLLLVGRIGVGKTAIANELVNNFGYKKVVTYTTRPKRKGEVDGKDYIFVSETSFFAGKNDNQFLETTSYKVANGETWYYGTPKYFDDSDKKVLIVNPTGLKAIKKAFPHSLVIEVQADKATVLERLQKRGDDFEEVHRRMKQDDIDFCNIDVLTDRTISTDMEFMTVRDYARAIDDVVNKIKQRKIIYISGGMTGVPNYETLFNKAEKKLRDAGYDVMNPAKFNQGLPEFDYDDYLEIDCYLLSHCDGIFMLDNWKQSKGAKAELNLARERGLLIMYEKEAEKKLQDECKYQLLEELDKSELFGLYEYLKEIFVE